MEIYELLMAIKRRPLMYVCEEKIEYIYHFLMGFCGASCKYNTDRDDNIDCRFVAWFGIWLDEWKRTHRVPDDTPYSSYWYNDIKKLQETKRMNVKYFMS